MYDFGIINGKLYQNGRWVNKNLYGSEGKIQAISAEFFEARELTDVNGMEVIPGVIDPHVHFELEGGSIKSVDDFYSGSVAAAYGGVTSIIDFLDPVDCAEDLEAAYLKRLNLAKKSIVDYAFHATIKNPKSDLEAFVLKMKSLGMNSLKLFTTYSDSGRRTYDEAIIELLKLSKKHKFLLMAHIENDDLIRLDDTFTYRDLPKSRPPESETSEALKLAEFTKKTNGNMYMVHLSSGKTLESLLTAYPDLINEHFFIESCPQYFTFTQDDLKKKDGYLYTFAPPLRSSFERDLLLRLRDSVYAIGTDHCAYMKADKKAKTLKETPLGIGGIEHSLNIMRYHLSDDAIDKMTRNVALSQRLATKGELKVGLDADLVIYERNNRETIRGNHGTSDYSLYEGLPSAGRVISTMLRGKFILKDNQFLGGVGKLIGGNKKP